MQRLVRTMKSVVRAERVFVLAASFAVPAFAAAQRGADRWEEAFTAPSASTRPWCYWYWISDNVSTAGITRDLEAMQRVGIAAALIGHIYLPDSKPGDVPLFSDTWWTAIRHALREADRLGIEIGLFNCPGWSQSGGPWNPPERSMRRLAFSETLVRGPGPVSVPLPAPAEPPYQDLAVLALPDLEETSIRSVNPVVTTRPDIAQVDRLWDDKTDTFVQLPRAVEIEFLLPRPLVIQSLMLQPTQTEFRAKIEVSAWTSNGPPIVLRQAVVDRRNLRSIVGYWPFGPVTLSWSPVTATAVRVAIQTLAGSLTASELILSDRPKVEFFVEKQLAKMCPEPLPTWNWYRWPSPGTDDSSPWRLLPENVLNISSSFHSDGYLRWVAPTGSWRILRFGWASTGVSNHPASPEGTGLEVDKLNRRHVAHHFDSFIGEVLRRIPPTERRALKYVVVDSYETGGQNWTDDFRQGFQREMGYDPLPWWPALAGVPVGSPDLSDRFLWDLRRWVADQVAREYVGGLREMCERHGLRLWVENYGHWGFPSEFLLYGKYAHMLGGEFWVPWRPRADEIRAASSAGHIYGHRRISAEAFTSGRPFEFSLADIQPVGDWVLTHGINHWVLHVVLHQPWEDRRPGVTAWFGTEFNRHTPWLEMTGPFVEYYRRCHAVLQEGWPANDLAYFIGEDAPVMVGTTTPPPPEGYDFDFVNADVILHRFSVRNGRWTLPDGHSYALLVLPPSETMRPEVLRRVRDLVRQGGHLYGPPPRRSPSLKNYPVADQEVRMLATELWGEKGLAGATDVVDRAVGRGRVWYGLPLDEALRRTGATPIVRDLNGLYWVARRTDTVLATLLVNMSAKPLRASPLFSIADRKVEIWDPLTGTRAAAPVLRVEPDGIRVGVTIPPQSSLFVVFRPSIEKPPATTTMVTLKRDGTVQWSADPTQIVPAPPATDPAAIVGDFTYAVYVEPAVTIQLPSAATNRGSFLHLTNDWVVYPQHGGHFGDPGTESGVGLSVGRNGIAVYEHGHNLFVPTLVHSVALTGRSHVVVVYRDGRPHLYLNGVEAAIGLPSGRKAHPSASGCVRPHHTFRGRASMVEVWPKPLDIAQIRVLAAQAQLESIPDPIRRCSIEDRCRLIAFEAGDYESIWADGRKTSCIVGKLPSLQLSGPWTVEFPTGSGAPHSGVWNTLIPLDEHTNAAIRHFAGRLRYRHVFVWTANCDRVELDLGAVHDTAEVCLNNRSVGIVWKPPYRLDITPGIRLGTNELVVTVAVGWKNRIVGHLRHSDGLPGAGPDAEPLFLTQMPRGWNPQMALNPAGLIGPVCVRGGQYLRLEVPK